MNRFAYLLLVFCVLPALLWAHGGEDHSQAAPAATVGSQYFSAEAVSDKYEVLVKYAPIRPGKPATLQLYLSEALTNRPVIASRLVMRFPDLPNLALQATPGDSGVYRISTTFPKAGSFDLQVELAAGPGPDLLLLKGIAPGKELPGAPEEAHEAWYTGKWFLTGMAFLAGLGLALVSLRRPRSRKGLTLLTLLAMLPTALWQPATAHGGEDHSQAAGKSAGPAASPGRLLVEKETQFLFQLYTQVASNRSFAAGTPLVGTVVAGPQGLAQVQTPQTGRIAQLLVRPGQQVRKGQTLLVVEQQVEASTQLNILSQRNQLAAELEAARRQYQRLQAVADIAAARDVSEARARYETARRNYALFNANAGGGGAARRTAVTAPISGTVGNFNYALGAVVQPGQTIMELTNLGDVLVEVQQFGAEPVASTYSALVAGQPGTIALERVTGNLSVNPANQSQRILFRVSSPNAGLRPGQNVQVMATRQTASQAPVVPLEAITDINGKPALFVKLHAEEFALRTVRIAQQNGQFAIVAEGLAEDEKIITHNVYQMKMIYLGQ